MHRGPGVLTELYETRLCTAAVTPAANPHRHGVATQPERPAAADAARRQRPPAAVHRGGAPGREVGSPLQAAMRATLLPPTPVDVM